ncbi:MAG TPA: type IV pilus secretin PilQ [Chromatiaceae bacterium]|nr:type IV pilus secretin PilQ [Chromatiaceae bacterium]HIA09002.1 type IV pilus secretin PilQ [Chromatiaceae bacterium]HIO15091.1 type IV pilus secretin PilQ [Chromatiales bacterium]
MNASRPSPCCAHVAPHSSETTLHLAGQPRLMLFLGALLFFTTQIAQAASNTLTGITSTGLSGDRVQVSLTFEQDALKPPSFIMDNPARIVLDLMNTGSSMSRRSQSVNVGLLRSVTAIEAGNRTRVVLNMVDVAPFETRVDGNQVHLILGASHSTAVDTSDGPMIVAASSQEAGGNQVSGVDFRRGAEGQALVTVSLNDPSVTVDLRTEGRKVILDILDSSIAERLSRRLDVTDFATPVTLVDTYSDGNNVRVAVETTGDFDQLSYQTDNLYVLEFRPASKEEVEQARRDRFQYTGERLSLNFQDIEVRAVLQLLADFTDLNMVSSDSVAGNVTLRLNNVPWDQALDLVLKTKGLSKRQVGNVILIAPTEEVATREKLELEAQQQLQELAQLHSEFIQINYAKASDMATLLKSEDNRLLSERGNVTVDERTNTLLVQDTAKKLEDIRKLVARLDIPVRQVLIESRIVIANNDFAKDLGVRFGLSGFQEPNSGSFLIGGGLKGNLDTNGLVDRTFIDIPAGDPLTEALITDLPAASAAGSVNLLLGRVGTNLLRLELSAMQAEGRGEVLSSPRLITSDQHPAEIKQGIEIPFEEATSSGATSISFKEAVLSLKVIPQITPDDRIIMELEVSKDSIGEIIQTRSGSSVPSIDTRTISTKILVENGDTVVLGGIYEETNNFVVKKVPFFGDLPIIGGAFRSKSEISDARELLIFITPRILKESLSLNY